MKPAGTLAFAAVFAACVASAQGGEWRPKERWRGFNLTEMLNRDWNPDSHGFEEEDFRFVSEWGFNFVRLPLDYRYWIKDGDRKNWETFDESGFRKVDAAIEFGRKYGVHVQACLHRIPGYTSGTPSEPTDIFSDPESLRVACLHWRAIARRYKGVPNDVLTFNLFNEPPYIDEAKYVPVAKALIGAIRAEDAERFIIADGVGYGRLPVRALEGESGVGFGMRGYDPNSVTHYKVPWLRLPDEPPTWPLSVDAPYGILAGPVKPDMKRPLELLSLPAGRATIAFGRVSGCVKVRFTADGRQCSERVFGPKEGGSETVELPNGAERLVVEAVEGDWIIPSRIEVESSDGSRKAVLVPSADWGMPKNFSQRFAGWQAGFVPCGCGAASARYADPGMEYHYRKALMPWDATIESGRFLYVGEFGVWRMTPHETALAFMEDVLSVWKDRGIGWALWNLRGDFGVLDSNRADVEYEDFRGHKLDRKMLELLQRN